MKANELDYLGKFERLEIGAADFHHMDHLKAAYAMLNEYDFIDACARYASTIRQMAERVGAADKFNMTITVAFISLIAERKLVTNTSGFSAFIEANPDLLDRKVLSQWYSSERLSSATARSLFLLPDAGDDQSKSAVLR